MSGYRFMGREVFRVTLEGLPSDDSPSVVRLRIALKTLLRAFRLKCRRVEDLTPYPAGKPADDQGQAGATAGTPT
jgi:hypothetical protein